MTWPRLNGGMTVALMRKWCRPWRGVSSLSSAIADPLSNLTQCIHQELSSDNAELVECSRYLFDGRGKAIRPTMVLLMASACNCTHSRVSTISPAQQTVAMVTEMIHTASLIHDDIIDGADMRRSKPTVNKLWGEKKAVLAGNFILGRASSALSCIGNPRVVDLLSNVIEDLVRGEVMQLGHLEDREALFDRYLQKTFKKTASLMAYSCQAAAVLSGGVDSICQAAFHYGKNTGLAFQVVDDVLDFNTSPDQAGKPTFVDMRLGLATAPVLLAAQEYPELYEMMKRKFSRSGDIKAAMEAVSKSGAITKSLSLSRQYSEKAVSHIHQLTPCAELSMLEELAIEIVNRNK